MYTPTHMCVTGKSKKSALKVLQLKIPKSFIVVFEQIPMIANKTNN